jgi:hypothetical protein
MFQRLAAVVAIVAPTLLLGQALAQTTHPAAPVDASTPALSLLNRCDQGQERVWPTVEAYAALKGFPPATILVESYRYLVLRILEMCNDGDTLVLGDRIGDSGGAFRRLMVEFCYDEDIKSSPIPGVDLAKNPNAATLSCKVTKIDALKGRPSGMPPASMTQVIPHASGAKP